ncbi:MAG: hypothetical protein MO853_08550 [Candidatus Protistobacter heckmanni]|nr:hypothetical protein [Candidatus Protistobacter heckmanni]
MLNGVVAVEGGGLGNAPREKVRKSQDYQLEMAAKLEEAAGVEARENVAVLEFDQLNLRRQPFQERLRQLRKQTVFPGARRKSGNRIRLELIYPAFKQ